MAASEVSVDLLNIRHSSSDSLQEGELDRKLQGKCLVLVSPVTIMLVYCLLITVLTAAVVGLSVALSDMRNWTHSHASCVELEAQLAQFDSLEELNVLRRYQSSSDHWIGLCRESSGQPWKWTDRTEYNNTVDIRGDGECAYLNDNGISSTRNYTERKWICSKAKNYVVQCPNKLGYG